MILDPIIFKEYCTNIKGILHIGAHRCEEQSIYNTLTDTVYWVEANPDLAREHSIIHACVSDVDGEEIWFNITNNLQSSSIFELDKHLEYYPDIKAVRQIKLETTTLKTLIDKHKINSNLLVMDIQGAELKALKGLGSYISNFDYIYTELNTQELYKSCAQKNDIDAYLKQHNFMLVEYQINNQGWGDGLYIRLPIQPPCYWINLPTRQDRYKQTIEQLVAQQLTHTLIVPPPLDSEHKTCKAANAHLKAILQAYRDGHSSVVIMEDDIDLSVPLSTYMDYWKYLPEDWDVFQMHFLEPLLVGALAEAVENGTQYPNRVLRGTFASCACYLMNRRGMIKVLNLMGNFVHGLNDQIWGDYLPTYTVANERGKAEDITFTYINGYMNLYPYYNTIENYKSDVNQTIEYQNFHFNNMNEIKRLIDVLPNGIIPPPEGDVVVLPKDFHYIHAGNNAKDFLEYLFNKKKVYMPYLHSGLGNRLFQWCSVYGIARDNDADFRVYSYAKNFQHDSSHENYANFFKEPVPTKISYEAISVSKLLELDSGGALMGFNNIIPTNLKVIKQSNPYSYEYPQLLNENKAYLFDGFWQNEKYFLKYRTDILEQFKEPEYITQTLNQIQGYDNIVAIHVRLGDFMDHPHIFVNLLVYYENAINFTRKILGKNIQFVLVSNVPLDKIYSFYHTLRDIPPLIHEVKDELIDLYFMSRCRGVICSNSTFSWWGAWFNNRPDKFITIPSRWLNNTNQVIEFNGAHIISI